MTYPSGSDPEPITLSAARPVSRPVMLQGWHNLTSLHWAYEPSMVQKLLPRGYTVDTFDNAAWVGLIPFHMRRIRLPFGPSGGFSAGRFATFPETNVRTYIVDASGRRAVWFFSLDITRMAPTLIARVAYGLPYCWATMSIETPSPDVVSYTSQRRWPRPDHAGSASSVVTIRIGDRLTETSPTAERDAFLSARWALGSTFARQLVWADVDHPAWVLHTGELLECRESLVSAAGLAAPTGNPVVLWSPGVEVRIGRPHLVKTRPRVALSWGLGSEMRLRDAHCAPDCS